MRGEKKSVKNTLQVIKFSYLTANFSDNVTMGWLKYV